jgi:hypothetical protein
MKAGLFKKQSYGPWAVVTGGSSGIGHAVASELARAGFSLVLVSRGGAGLDAAGEAVRQAGAADHRLVATDLAEPNGGSAVIDACAGLDVGLLVACAGFGTSGDFVSSDLSAELAMLAVNGSAVLTLSHHFAKRFVARGRGGLVFLGSIVAYQGVPGAAHYAATKAYVQCLGEALRVELRDRGVDVLVASPGPVRTGFGARAGMQMGVADSASVVASEIVASLGRRGVVAPGPVSKLLTLALSTAPRRLRVRIMAAIMGGMIRAAQR